MLERHLAGNKSHTVNDTASFSDYFGHDNGLKRWSLLMVAASVWVNAPRCMKLLLDLGANPLQKDSSERHVLMEALSTARKGKLEPWNLLQGLQQRQQPEQELADDDSNTQSSSHVETIIFPNTSTRPSYAMSAKP